jgi:hypothetical protein
MPDDISARLPKILGDLKRAAEEVLNVSGVHDVMAYGWVDCETPDQDYMGHAIWQTSPPFQPDWTALIDGGTVPHLPSATDEVLTLSGEDFIGTMIFARRSIGLALCYTGSADPGTIDDGQEFWHEYTTSLQWLSIASDRLRDFFIMAAFHKTKKQYEKNDRARRMYSEPFKGALRRADDARKQHLRPLLLIASKIEQRRRERNRIVHEVATKVAHTSICVLREQRDLAQSGKPKQIPAVTFEELQERRNASLFNEAVSAPVLEMKEWYVNLIDASNLVFQFEYFERTPVAE